MTETAGPTGGRAPKRQAAVLGTLILVATVANLNLSVANVALPDIGDAFDASQTQLNLIAIGYSLGLATSVLYLGALGDRYGRKKMLIAGTALAIPFSLLASFAPTADVLFLARFGGGIAAGMAFPTTLALITALWSGPGRTRSIALWSGVGGAMAALGPLLAGGLLLAFDWGSVFLITLPLALIALVLSLRLVPANVDETSDPVDNLGGILSVVMVAGVVLAINFATIPGAGALALGIALVGIAAAVGFVIRQRRASNPLYDLEVAARSTFWVAAVAGIIVFGTLMAAMFIGQQYLQNVLDWSTWQAGLAILPAAVALVMVAPFSAKLVDSRGARFTLLAGYLFCFFGFIVMLLFWSEDSTFPVVIVAYMLVGIGVGLAGTPASHSLTGSVPVRRAGMASATADLQRDLGGAIMQSILGVFLTAGYATSFSRLIASSPNSAEVSESVEVELERSFSSAANIAEQYPQYSDQIIEAAKQSFIKGEDLAYLGGIVAILLGAALVWRFYPKYERETELLALYASEDAPQADS